MCSVAICLAKRNCLSGFKEGLSFFRQYFVNHSGREPVNSDNFVYAEECYHPLVIDPKKNSFEFNKKGMLITGSNMAGKSTFLRTVGINSLFVQTIFTCLAKEYKTSFLRIISSIN